MNISACFQKFGRCCIVLVLALAMSPAMIDTACSITRVTMTVSYLVVGGGSPTPPTFNYVQDGVSKTYTLTTSPVSIPVDEESVWLVTPNPLAGSNSSEHWYSFQELTGSALSIPMIFAFQHRYYLTMQVNPSGAGTTIPASGWQNASALVQISANPDFSFKNWIGNGNGSYTGTDNPARVTINSAVTEIADFIRNVEMTVSYLVVGGGSPTPPTFNYVQDGVSKTYTLTTSPTSITVDIESRWSVTPNPLSGSNSSERWYANHAISDIASAAAISFVFYHQYRETLSYSVNDKSSGYSPPTFTAEQFGSSVPETLQTSEPEYWFDWRSSWNVTNPLPGSKPFSEQWWAVRDTRGTITAATTMVFLYQHQYYLKMNSSLAGAAVMPMSGWQDAGARVRIASAPPNSTYSFNSWTGTGAGNYTGTDNSATVTMNSPISQTANFIRTTMNLTPVVLSLATLGLLFGVFGLIAESRAVLRIRPTAPSPRLRETLRSTARPVGVCPRCQHANRQNARFCTRCGRNL